MLSGPDLTGIRNVSFPDAAEGELNTIGLTARRAHPCTARTLHVV